jgi:hypothetical protein
MAQTDRRGIVFQNCADASDRVAVRSMAADVVHGYNFVDWCLMVSKGRPSSGQATGVLDVRLHELQNRPKTTAVSWACSAIMLASRQRR